MIEVLNDSPKFLYTTEQLQCRLAVEYPNGFSYDIDQFPIRFKYDVTLLLKQMEREHYEQFSISAKESGCETDQAGTTEQQSSMESGSDPESE